MKLILVYFATSFLRCKYILNFDFVMTEILVTASTAMGARIPIFPITIGRYIMPTHFPSPGPGRIMS